jgi:hypothetical protein
MQTNWQRPFFVDLLLGWIFIWIYLFLIDQLSAVRSVDPTCTWKNFVIFDLFTQSIHSREEHAQSCLTTCID